MRSFYGVCFLWCQIVLMSLGFVFLVVPLFPIISPRIIISLVLIGLWLIASYWRKAEIMVNAEDKSGLIPSILGIIAAAAFLVIFNPGSHDSTTLVGTIVAVSSVVVFLLDTIDYAYQKTCKA